MATLKLKKPAAAPGRPTPDRAPSRAPVRGTGSGLRRRPTLAEAQAERAEREAQYTAQRGAPRRDDRAPDPRGPKSPAPTGPAGRPARPGPRQDPRAEPRSDPRSGPRAGPRQGPRPDPRGDARDPREERSARNGPARDEQRPTRPSRPPLPPARSAPNTAFGARPARPERPERPERPTAAPTPPAPRRAERPPRGRERHDHDDEPPEHAPGSLRLSKRMSELGLASRREADEWIAKGWVRVDGRVVAELGARVMPDQQVTIDARARGQQAQRVTVLVNKPVGYVSGQAEDGYEPAWVLVKPENQWREDRSGVRFQREHLKSLVPAGRLDIDSVGLLVLTQDGRVAKQLVGEDSAVEKEYLVRVEPQVDGDRLPDSELERLRHGLELDGEALQPARVEWINDDQLRFVLTEGKKRQIRRMCEAVGLKVVGLKRVRIGRVMLGDLPSGQWRYLRLDESFV